MKPFRNDQGVPTYSCYCLLLFVCSLRPQILESNVGVLRPWAILNFHTCQVRIKTPVSGTSLVVLWLRLHASTTEHMASISGQELRPLNPRGVAKKKNLSHGTTLRIKEDNRLKSLVQISSHSSDHYYFILCQPLICFYNSCLNFPYLHLKGIKKDSPPPEFPTFSRIMQELLGTKVMRNDPFISLLVLFPKGIIIQSISKDLHTKT